MDIWHRVGRIVRFSNLGTLLFFTLNILLIVAVFGSSVCCKLIILVIGNKNP